MDDKYRLTAAYTWGQTEYDIFDSHIFVLARNSTGG